LRNGPLVHRNAQVSRALQGAPSPLERLAALSALADRRPTRAPTAGPIWESSRLYLGSRLPINLRSFLAEQLGPSIRVESDSIVALKQRSGAGMMRDLARAIRRFSAERARQVWSECAIGMARLQTEFFRAPAGERCPVILCLRCACIGAGPLDEHGGRNCLPVNLDSAIKDFATARSSDRPNTAPDLILQAIENFRMARDAAQLPHQDLDCFVSNGQLVFTWRPLPDGPVL
jgi:hypothetical protein